MLQKLLKRKDAEQRGFTIIEVMIVLAIAGLIILIVLLAVPALQRNARNTAIKNDASAVAAAINEFKSNNDGGSPKAAAAITGKPGQFQMIATPPSPSSDEVPAQFKVQKDTIICPQDPMAAVPSVPDGTSGCTSGNANGNIFIRKGFACDNTGTPNPRALAIYYPVEQANGDPKMKCIDS